MVIVLFVAKNDETATLKKSSPFMKTAKDESMHMLRSACRIHLDPMIHRYLIANSDGRWDGAEKALRHKEMCQFYVAAWSGLTDPESVSVNDHWYIRVHHCTQMLTDRLDEVIGFPLNGHPDYDRLAGLFFSIFHDLALFALSNLNIDAVNPLATSCYANSGSLRLIEG